MEEYENTIRRFFDEYFSLYPTIASFAGLKKYNKNVPRITREDYEKKIDFAEKWDETFAGVDDSKLDMERRVDLWTMRSFVKNMKIFLMDYPVYRMCPTAHIAVMDSLFSTVNHRGDFLARVSKLPKLLEDYVKDNPVDMPVDIFLHRVAREVGNIILSLLEMERTYNLNLRSLIRSLQKYSSYMDEISPNEWKPPSQEVLEKIPKLRGFEELNYDILKQKIKEENEIIEDIAIKIDVSKDLSTLLSEIMRERKLKRKSDFMKISKMEVYEINKFIERKYIKEGYEKIGEPHMAPAFLNDLITDIYYEYRGPYSDETGKIMVLPPQSPMDFQKYTDLEIKILIDSLMMDHIKISYFNKNKSEVRKLLYHLGLWPEVIEGIFKTDFSGSWEIYALKHLVDKGLFTDIEENLIYHIHLRNFYAGALSEKTLYEDGLDYASRELSKLINRGEEECARRLAESAYFPLFNSLRAFGYLKIEDFIREIDGDAVELHKKLLANGPICLDYQKLLIEQKEKN